MRTVSAWWMSNSSTAVQFVSSERPHVEHPEETRHRHPEVVSDNQQSMNPDAVALTKRPDQLGVLRDLVRLEPLFKLVDHDEQLPVDRPGPWPRRMAARSSERGNSVDSPWHLATTAAASRRSVSAGVASTNTETTESASRGSRPALISDDLPHPEGPYRRPTLNGGSPSRSSIRVFQKQTDSGSPSRPRGPGSRSRNASESCLSKARRPLGTTWAASGGASSPGRRPSVDVGAPRPAKPPRSARPGGHRQGQSTSCIGPTSA